MTVFAAPVVARQPEGAGAARGAATAYRDRVRNPAGTGGAPIAYWRLAEIAEAPAVDTQELQDGIYHGPIEYLVPGPPTAPTGTTRSPATVDRRGSRSRMSPGSPSRNIR